MIKCFLCKKRNANKSIIFRERYYFYFCNTCLNNIEKYKNKIIKINDSDYYIMYSFKFQKIIITKGYSKRKFLKLIDPSSENIKKIWIIERGKVKDILFIR